MSYEDSTRPVAPCKGYFVMVPVGVATDHRLIDRDRTVLAHLISYAWAGKSTCNPSNSVLAKELGCCPRTVQLSFGRLDLAGLIRRQYLVTKDAAGRTRTSRTIVLVWREADCAPPAQSDASPPAQRVAPESRERRETRTAPMGLSSPGPTKRGNARPVPAIPLPPPFKPIPPAPLTAAEAEREIADALAMLATMAPNHPMRGLCRKLAGLPVVDNSLPSKPAVAARAPSLPPDGAPTTGRIMQDFGARRPEGSMRKVDFEFCIGSIARKHGFGRRHRHAATRPGGPTPGR